MNRIRTLALGLAAAFALSGLLPASAGSPVYLNDGSCAATGTTHQYGSYTQGVTFGGQTGCLAGLDFFGWDPVYGQWLANGFQAGYIYLSSSIGISTTGKSNHLIYDGVSGQDSGYSYSWL